MSTVGTEEKLLLKESVAHVLWNQSQTHAGIGHSLNVLLTSLELSADALAAVCGVVLTYWLYLSSSEGNHIFFEWRSVFLAGLAFGAIMLLLLERLGAYERGISLLRIRETERCLKASATALLWCCPLTFVGGARIPRLAFLIGMVVIPVILVAEKQLVCIVIGGLQSRGYGLKKVLIYGAGYTGHRVLSALARSPKLGLTPLALVDDDPERSGECLYVSDYRRGQPIPVISGPLSSSLLRETDAEIAVVAIPSIDPDKFIRTIEECAAAKIPCYFVSAQAFGSELLTEYIEVDGLMLHSFSQSRTRAIYDTSKRLFDIVVGAVMVVALLPLFLLLAALVKLDSKGPVLFKQQRVGKDGKLFTMYKYRTMYTEACGTTFSPTRQDDRRITKIGRFLRRTSADEFPQILNVLRGEMSLVGPRPEMPFIVEGYSIRERQRLHVIPGITCLWQLSADRSVLIHENIQYDLYYIRNRGFFLDLAILLHTAIFAMRGI